jgi:hypothetical protein
MTIAPEIREASAEAVPLAPVVRAEVAARAAPAELSPRTMKRAMPKTHFFISVLVPLSIPGYL